MSTRNGLSMLTRPIVALLSRIREHELWRESPYCLNWQPVEFRPIRLLELFCLWRNAKWCQLTCQKQRHTSAKWQMDHQKPTSMLFLNGYGQFQQTRYVLKDRMNMKIIKQKLDFIHLSWKRLFLPVDMTCRNAYVAHIRIFSM